jgi:hypothetical protein
LRLKATRNFERAAKISLDLAQQEMQTGNANALALTFSQVDGYRQCPLGPIFGRRTPPPAF